MRTRPLSTSRLCTAARRIDQASAVAAASLAAISVLISAYLGLLTVAGAGAERARRVAKRPDRDRVAPPGRTLVLVPAHDEAPVIERTLCSVAALATPEAFTVHVVADHCGDTTADAVRGCGVEVHERDSGTPGKGPALNWLLDRLIERGEQFDSVAIVDADTVVDPSFIDEARGALADGAVAVQGWYGVLDAEASPAAAWRAAALASRHHLRPLGRTALGSSSGLFGNAIVFRRDIAEAHRWSGHLVEDAELQLRLLAAGHVVAYAPDARVAAEMPDERDAATSQNERWERGRLELVHDAWTRLIRQVVTGPRRGAALDTLADLLVPPLSVVVTLQSAVLAATGVRRGVRRRGTTAAVASFAALSVTALHIVTALWSVDAPRSTSRALADAPRAVWWKVTLWLRVRRPGHEVQWARTRRNDGRTTMG